MDWSPDSLYSKAKLYAQRAHDEDIESAMFGFWMSLSLELLARAALAHIHPVLLADPREQDNIHYAFGIIPKRVAKSIPAKAIFARCSVLIPNFTDEMSGHCLIIADRRNSELHSGPAAFEGVENSTWLPASYGVVEVLLNHLNRDFNDFLGENHGKVAAEMLKDRRDTIKKDVQEKLAAARKLYSERTQEWKTEHSEKVAVAIESFKKSSRLHRASTCPACGATTAGMTGEIVGRSPVRIDESSNTIRREARVLPNRLACPTCKLELKGYQEMNEAGLGDIYTIEEEEDPIEFFGIIPEEYVDVDELVRQHLQGYDEGYNNE